VLLLMMLEEWGAAAMARRFFLRPSYLRTASTRVSLLPTTRGKRKESTEKTKLKQTNDGTKEETQLVRSAKRKAAKTTTRTVAVIRSFRGSLG